MILTLSDILTILILILVIIPLIIYLLYGKSLKIKSVEKIYFKPPSNDSPAIINSFFDGGINKQIGEINTGSFYLTLLDLINRNYISVKIISKKQKPFNKKQKDNKGDAQNKLNIFHSKKFELGHEKELSKIILKINKHSDELHAFEKNVLKCLSALENKGNIDILNTNEALKKRLKVNTFQKNYDGWIKNFHEEFFKDNSIFFKRKFSRILEIYGIFLLVAFFSIAIFSYFNNFSLNLVLSFVMGILGVYLILYPFNLVGWTTEGKELRISWMRFKKYYGENIKDSNPSQEFLDNGIKFIPYILALGISKSSLIKTFSQSSNITDSYLFLKYSDISIIKEIITDFLAADGSFDPKYYNTSGNFVPGYGL